MTNNIPNLIGEAAELSLRITAAQQAGYAPQPSDVFRLSQIDDLARSRLSPQQYAEAQRHFHDQRAALIDQASQEVERVATRQKIDDTNRFLAEKTANFATGALNGMQYQQARRTGKATIKNPEKSPLNLKELDNRIRQTTGRSLKKHEETLDDLGRLYLEDKTQAKLAAEKAGVDFSAVRDWARGSNYEFEAQKRRAERTATDPDEIEVELTDDDRRRQDMLDALSYQPEFMKTEKEDFIDNNRDLLEEDSRSGDIARAMLAHEGDE